MVTAVHSGTIWSISHFPTFFQLIPRMNCFSRWDRSCSAVYGSILNVLSDFLAPTRRNANLIIALIFFASRNTGSAARLRRTQSAAFFFFRSKECSRSTGVKDRDLETLTSISVFRHPHELTAPLRIVVPTVTNVLPQSHRHSHIAARCLLLPSRRITTSLPNLRPIIATAWRLALIDRWQPHDFAYPCATRVYAISTVFPHSHLNSQTSQRSRFFPTFLIAVSR